jgi:hypothetical protein
MHDIWDSIASEMDQSPVTDAQRLELDRRIAALDANPADVIPWEGGGSPRTSKVCEMTAIQRQNRLLRLLRCQRHRRGRTIVVNPYPFSGQIAVIELDPGAFGNFSGL